jgi:hypothetical protein
MAGKTLSIILITLSVCAGVACAEGLGTLIEVGGNMADIAAEQAAQTARFARVKRDMDSGTLVRGMSRDAVIAQYGEPVIANTDTATGREKIVYMPSTSDFLKGIKAYLYFSGGTLDEITVKH